MFVAVIQISLTVLLMVHYCLYTVAILRMFIVIQNAKTQVFTLLQHYQNFKKVTTKIVKVYLTFSENIYRYLLQHFL